MRYNKIDRNLSVLKVNLILERFRNLILSQDYLLKNKLHTNTGIIKFSDNKNNDYEKQLINKIVASDQEIKLIKDVLIAVDKLPYKQRYIITEIYIRNKDFDIDIRETLCKISEKDGIATYRDRNGYHRYIEQQEGNNKVWYELERSKKIPLNDKDIIDIVDPHGREYSKRCVNSKKRVRM